MRSRERHVARLTITGEDAGVALRVKGNHVEGLRGSAFNFHTRRADGHAGNGDACDVGSFGEQTLQGVCGNMSFHYVAIHDGCVTTIKRRGNSMLLLHRREVFSVFNLYGVAVLLQVRYPVATTASQGRRVDEDGGKAIASWRSRRLLALRRGAGGNQQDGSKQR